MTKQFKKMKIRIFQKGIRDDIDLFKVHVTGIESYLKKEVDDLVNYHEERTKDYSEEEKEEYYEFYSDDYWLLNEIFPNIQRKSELIGVYTLLENHLNVLCSIYEKHSNSAVKVSDLKGKGIIDTARKYLTKVLGIGFPTGNEWSEIKSIQRIRNLFVHNDGKLKGSEEDKRPIKEYIDRSPYLKLDQFERILIDKGFSEHCLSTFRKFFDDLCTEIDRFETTNLTIASTQTGAQNAPAG